MFDSIKTDDAQTMKTTIIYVTLTFDLLDATHTKTHRAQSKGKTDTHTKRGNLDKRDGKRGIRKGDKVVKIVLLCEANLITNAKAYKIRDFPYPIPSGIRRAV